MPVRNNAALSRFELEAEGGTAVANYRLEDGVMTFFHTETPAHLQGRGIASQLVRGARSDQGRQPARVPHDPQSFLGGPTACGLAIHCPAAKTYRWRWKGAMMQNLTRLSNLRPPPASKKESRPLRCRSEPSVRQ
jgi:hypothetical protein